MSKLTPPLHSKVADNASMSVLRHESVSASQNAVHIMIQPLYKPAGFQDPSRTPATTPG